MMHHQGQMSEDRANMGLVAGYKYNPVEKGGWSVEATLHIWSPPSSDLHDPSTDV